MENQEKQIKTINELVRNKKFLDAIEFALEEGLDKKLPDIYFKMEKAGANIPGYAASDVERFGYLSAAIRYNKEWVMDSQKAQNKLKSLERWILKSKKEITEKDNYYIPSLLLEDAEQTGNSIDRNFNKTKKLIFLKGEPFIESLELLRYDQN